MSQKNLGDKQATAIDDGRGGSAGERPTSASDLPGAVPGGLRDGMARELANGELFRQSVNYGCDYLAAAKARHVAPAERDVERLEQFDEPLPDGTGSAGDVLELYRGKSGCFTWLWHRTA